VLLSLYSNPFDLLTVLTYVGSETLASNWCKDILAGIMAATPHTWSSYTLACFPPALSEFFQQQGAPARDDKQTLKRNVEMEFRKWKSE